MILAAVLLLGLTDGARAATYYVDPAGGDNANAGTTASTAWRTPPGTRNASNTGFASSAWGSVTSGNKVACGSTILLRGGATQTSTQGGAWLIDATYYNNCISGSPTTIKVASGAEWSGSSGHFTLDGSGISPVDGPYGYNDRGLINVVDRDYVHIRGDSASQRLRLIDSDRKGIVTQTNSPTNQMVGLWIDFVETANSNEPGIGLGANDLWKVSNVIAHDSRLSCVQTGLNNDHIQTRGGFVDLTAYNCSPSSIGFNNDGIMLLGGEDIWCIRCTVYRAGNRGVNTGVIREGAGGISKDFHYKFRDLLSHDNGFLCTIDCIGAGIDISGNNGDTPASYNTIVRGTFLDNHQTAFGSYGGGALEVWHTVAYDNSSGAAWLSEVSHNEEARQLDIFNTVLVATNGKNLFGSSDSGNFEPDFNATPVMMNNCFRPTSSDSEQLGAQSWRGTYSSPPAAIGPSNQIGRVACNPQFVNLTNDPLTANLTPGSTSSLIDAGRFLMLADGSGSNATTVRVKSNGGSGDPRNFFIAPGSYLEPKRSDMQVQIEGCGVRYVESMTATTITLNQACSWASNAGVSLPWSGARPDIGAVESGGGSPPPSPPSPPTLLPSDG